MKKKELEEYIKQLEGVLHFVSEKQMIARMDAKIYDSWGWYISDRVIEKASENHIKRLTKQQ